MKKSTTDSTTSNRDYRTTDSTTSDTEYNTTDSNTGNTEYSTTDSTTSNTEYSTAYSILVTLNTALLIVLLKSVRVEFGLFSLNIHLISIITQLTLTIVTHIPRVNNKNLP